MTCALTGHRDLPEDFQLNLLYDTLEELIREGYDTFLCGMARGFDLLALDCLIALKQKYRITLEACIPYRGHENSFFGEEKRRYLNLLERCDKRHYIYNGYANGCFLARDRMMVDRADLLFAYCMRATGGTAYTVRYAKKKGVEIRNLFREA
ncbi:MAG: DUF1273 domain-containing protein [Clostridiales bacterium]|nr:DUF1273 domain-containing protein [Clostridiales bacterium]